VTAAKTSETKVMIATEHFMVEDGEGRPHFVHPGQALKADHPIVKGREHLFREKTEED
jgi:hypothetical protein